MTTSSAPSNKPVRVCKRCGGTDRYASGHCKECKKQSDSKYARSDKGRATQRRTRESERWREYRREYMRKYTSTDPVRKKSLNYQRLPERVEARKKYMEAIPLSYVIRERLELVGVDLPEVQLLAEVKREQLLIKREIRRSKNGINQQHQ